MADLTRDAILALPAGPALDALVAERVLGWTRIKVPNPIPPGRGCDALRLPDGSTFVVNGGHAPRALPAYSTDIAAAWAVVEHLCPTANVSEPWFTLYSSGGKWVADFNRYTGGAAADTVPLAIARAALLATREEDRTDG